MLLLAAFAGLALLLSAVGIYGVMAYSVMQRTHEIGVRMALGAQRADVLKMILSQALRLTAIGLVIGLFAAFLATRVLATLLFGVKTTDPTTFMEISCLLALIAFAASYIPGWRATRVNPNVALRCE
jgi:putative ABC transport system permease protein